jgi:hypothetical protein
MPIRKVYYCEECSSKVGKDDEECPYCGSKLQSEEEITKSELLEIVKDLVKERAKRESQPFAVAYVNPESTDVEGLQEALQKMDRFSALALPGETRVEQIKTSAYIEDEEFEVDIHGNKFHRSRRVGDFPGEEDDEDLSLYDKAVAKLKRDHEERERKYAIEQELKAKGLIPRKSMEIMDGLTAREVEILPKKEIQTEAGHQPDAYALVPGCRHCGEGMYKYSETKVAVVWSCPTSGCLNNLDQIKGPIPTDSVEDFEITIKSPRKAGVFAAVDEDIPAGSPVYPTKGGVKKWEGGEIPVGIAMAPMPPGEIGLVEISIPEATRIMKQMAWDRQKEIVTAAIVGWILVVMVFLVAGILGWSVWFR